MILELRLDAASSPCSKELKLGLNIALAWLGPDFPGSDPGPKGMGEACVESCALSGGCRSPIDFAMQDMTSSRRSKSSDCILPASRIKEEVEPLSRRCGVLRREGWKASVK